MIFIIAAGDAEGSVVLTDGEVNTLAHDEEVNAIVEEVNAIVEGVHAVQDADGVAAWDAEDNVVLADGEGNVLAADEEGNTIVEAAEGSGVMLDSNGSIVLVGDAELRRC